MKLRSHLVAGWLIALLALTPALLSSDQKSTQPPSQQPAGRNNLALRRPVQVSSYKWSKPVEAVDGNEFQGSRWTSDFPRDGSRDHTAWLSVDLQAKHQIDKVRILWQRSRWARDYEIQISDDNQNWQSVWTVKNADEQGWRHEVHFAPVSTRYFRLLCTRTANGLRDRPGDAKFINMYSVIEFEVYAAAKPMDPLRFSARSTGKPARASVEKDNMYGRPRQINDGLMTTFWSAKPDLTPPWIYIDLEQPSAMTGLTIYWHRTPSQYSVEVSEAADQWKRMAASSQLEIETMDDEEVKEIHRLRLTSPVTGRFIRISIQGPPTVPTDSSYILQELLVDF